MVLGGGGGGRIAVYYEDRTAFTGMITAIGGVGSEYSGGGEYGGPAIEPGGAGTIYTKSSTQTWGDLVVDNGGNSGAATALPAGTHIFDTVKVANGGRLEVPVGSNLILLPDTLTIDESGHLIVSGGLDYSRLVISQGTFTLEGNGHLITKEVEVSGEGVFVLNKAETVPTVRIGAGGVLTHSSGQSGFNLTVLGDLVVEAGGAISVDGKGYAPYEGPGRGSCYSSGGGYGGAGGSPWDGCSGGGTYGLVWDPCDMGSGGGGSPDCGAGGGKIHLRVLGTLAVEGEITANGGESLYGSHGAGSGGSVFIQAHVLTGGGRISADGGGATIYGCGGGGGRIALYYDNCSFTGLITAYGGSGYEWGENGTIYNIQPLIHPLVLSKQYVSDCKLPFSRENWTFSAIAGQQVRFEKVNMSTPGIVFDLTGPENWAGFTGITKDTDLINLPYSGQYTLTARKIGDLNDRVYTFCLQETTVTDIQLNEIHHDTFVGSSQAQLFRVNVHDSNPIRIVLDCNAADNCTELYAQFGSPPTRGDYDYRHSSMAAPDQTILVPMAYSGDWYILVYGDVISTPSDYNLLAVTSDIVISSVTPNHHGNSTAAVLSLIGAGFNSVTTVELISDSNDIYLADSTQADSLTQMTARFAAGTVPAGIYSLRVSASGGNSDELPGAFEITEGGKANFKTNLIVPSVIGRDSQATIYVDCANTGEVAMPAPVLVVTATDRARIRLAPPLAQLAGPLKVVAIPVIGDTAAGFWTSAQPIGFSSTVHVLASGETPGIIQPGESFRVPVDFIGLERPWDMRDNSVRFDLGVLHPGNTDPVNWEDFKDQMRPESISEEAWEPLWDNFVAQTGNTWGDYVEMLTDNATYLGSLGLKVTDIRELLAFEFAQADGLSVVPYLSLSTDAYVEAPGLTLSFRRVYPNNIVARHAFGVLGYGWSHNWDISVEVAEDGTVTIAGPAGSRRVFQPDTRGGYFAEAGDYATLVALGGGAFSLSEKGGLLYTFHADGKLSYVEDTNGNRITAVYSADLLQTLTHSSGKSLDITHSPSGLIETITDPNTGRQTVFTYDVADEHLKEAKYFDGSIVRYDYIAGTGIASAHALKEVQSCCSRRVFNYDVLGRLNETYLGDFEERISLSYDVAGTVSVKDAFDNTFKFFYDHRGVLAKAENPLGHSMQMTYDSMYNLTSITDPTGRSHVYEYDARGNVSHLTDPLGSATRFSYDRRYNRLTSLIDAKGNTTDYQYDALDNMLSITYDDVSVESWSYDDPTSPGDPHSWTNRRGVPIKYEYDSSGRLVSKVYADGSRADYDYDTRGNLTSAINTYGAITLAYDANDRLERINYPGGQFLEFTYDAAGRRSSRTDQLGHRLDYQYDSVGHLERITNESPLDIVHYYYDAAGRLERKNLGNGVYTTYNYDGAGQLTRLTNFKPDDTVLSQFDYIYDSRARRTSMTRTYDSGTLAWTYEYDDAGQLIHAILDSNDPEIPDQDLTFVYDALGNRIETIVDGAITEYVTNNMNQYTTVGNVGLEYDDDGNLIAKDDPNYGATFFEYSQENRLEQVNSPEGIWQYVYDALGNRTRVNNNGSITDYVIDPIGFGDVVGEYDESGDLLARYDHGFGLLSRKGPGGDPNYYTFDAIGSTSEITNPTGLVLNSHTYQPFGEVTSSLETVYNPFKFVGEFGVMHETNGLDYMRARYYDSQLGRFVSMDPMGLAGGDLNLTAYVRNRPVAANDPSGLQQKGRPTWIKTPNTDPFCGRGARGCFDRQSTIYINSRFPKELIRSTEGHEYTHWRHRNRNYGIDEMEAYAYQWEIENLYNTGAYKYPLFVDDLFYYYYRSEYWKSFWDGFWHGYPLLPVTSQTSQIPTPRDPNKKIGPKGVGSRGFVVAGSLMPYRVEFENDPNATAPAQILEMTDPLDANLDWATFELTEVGFGGHLIAIPDNTQHFETSVPMDSNGVEFEVQIEAGIHLATGEVYAKFYSIDPNTSLPPTVNVGFLPPEDGTGRGMGHFSYVINTEPNLPTGTEIRNVAYITFDFIERIATNQIDPHDPSKGTDPAKECLNTIAILDCDFKADVNRDCRITLEDFALLSAQWLLTGEQGNCALGADLAGQDCVVNFQDLAILTSEWLSCGIDPDEFCWISE